MFPYTLDNKRYHTLNYFYRNKFNSKVFKVPLDAGFSCPNFKNGHGCIFCVAGSGNRLTNLSLMDQFNIVKIPLEKKWPNSKYIAYFQANSNTYASVDTLKEKFEPMLKIPNVVGLAIATRSDCLNDEILDYLSDLNKRTFLTVEIGLQSMHEETLELINRGHDLSSFENSIKELKKRKIFTVVHIINGLPYETKEMMIDTVKYLNNLGIDGIKIHMLYITSGTPIAKMYQNNPFHILSKEEYIDIVCNELEYLSPNIVIERITGDPTREELIAPNWLLKKFCVLNDIDKEMNKRDIIQGDKL
jgi:hypothetical protein